MYTGALSGLELIFLSAGLLLPVIFLKVTVLLRQSFIVRLNIFSFFYETPKAIFCGQNNFPVSLNTY